MSNTANTTYKPRGTESVTGFTANCFAIGAMRDEINDSPNWRFHSRLGVMQLYLSKHTRLHIWAPSLVDKEGYSVDTIHNHRFDLESWIISGTLSHVEYHTTDNPNGTYQLYQVLPAHNAIQEGQRPAPVAIGRPVDLINGSGWTMKTGDSYTFKKGAFHRTIARDGCITLVTKSNQTESDRALVLGMRDKAPSYGFEENEWLPKHQEFMIAALNKAFNCECK